VSMVARPGKVYLPVNPASPYPGGVKTFANEGDSSRLRDAVVSDLGTVAVVECNQPSAFKFGVDAVEGWMLGVIQVAGHGLVGYRDGDPRTRRAIAPGREFPDGGTSGCVRPPRLARFRRGSPCSWPVSPTGHVVPDPVRWELRAVSTSLGASRHGAPSSDLPVQRQQASCLVNAPSAADVPRPSL
jgi:hypothetical protein